RGNAGANRTQQAISHPALLAKVAAEMIAFGREPKSRRPRDSVVTWGKIIGFQPDPVPLSGIRSEMSLLTAYLVMAALLWTPGHGAVGSELDQALQVPTVGSQKLEIISPTFLELSLVTTKPPDPERPQPWDFVRENFELHLPGTNEFEVLVENQRVPVTRTGFKRR